MHARAAVSLQRERADPGVDPGAGFHSLDEPADAYRIVHTTRFHFSQPVTSFRGVARLTPRDRAWNVDFAQLATRPLAIPADPSFDRFCNRVVPFTIEGSFRRLQVSGIHTISRRTAAPREIPETTPSSDWLDPSPLTRPTPELRAFWSPPEGGCEATRRTIEHLMGRIRTALRFDPRSTGATTEASEALRLGSGVCHDLAHVAIACLRSIGIPAGFVWGYRLPEASLEPAERRPIARDVSHAWVASKLPGQAWCAFDPSAAAWVDDRYVEVARGRDLADVIAVEGRFEGGGRQRLEVQIDVRATGAAAARPG